MKRRRAAKEISAPFLFHRENNVTLKNIAAAVLASLLLSGCQHAAVSLSSAGMSARLQRSLKNKPALNRAQLLAAGQHVAAQLAADTTPLQEKCSEFNRSLAPFLAQRR